MKQWKYLPNIEKQRINNLFIKILFETREDINKIIFRKDLRKIKRGVLICTGSQIGNWEKINMNVLKYIGYTCQIRLGVGGFGSDEVFLRHIDGSLTPHSEQTFFKLSKKNTKRLNKLFSKMILKEKKQIWDKNLHYRTVEGVEKTGYLIEED